MHKSISQKYSHIIKIIICVLVLSVFYKTLIISFPNNIKTMMEEQKQIRIAAYIAEKKAVQEQNEELVLSSKYKDIYINNLWINDIDYECSFLVYINNVHPEIKPAKYIYKNDADTNITKTELNELKFQNLLQSKMYRHKKLIKSCY